MLKFWSFFVDYFVAWRGLRTETTDAICCYTCDYITHNTHADGIPRCRLNREDVLSYTTPNWCPLKKDQKRWY